MYTNNDFDIGLLGIHHITASREVHQLIAIGILWQERIVLV